MSIRRNLYRTDHMKICEQHNGCVFTTPVVSLNIPKGYYVTRKIIFHDGNLRSASARMKQFE